MSKDKSLMDIWNKVKKHKGKSRSRPKRKRKQGYDPLNHSIMDSDSEIDDYTKMIRGKIHGV